MRITLNWTAELNECPSCGDEHDCESLVQCPACGYHAGNELAEQWVDFVNQGCESLPVFLELGECYEPQSGGVRPVVTVEALHRLSEDEEHDLRRWIETIHGEAEEGDIMALVAGCSNPFSPSTRHQLEEIIEEMESIMGAESFNQLFDHQRRDVEETLDSARSALENFDSGDETWIGQDDDGYWFRYVPRGKAA
jgi:hypothetical protein